MAMALFIFPINHTLTLPNLGRESYSFGEEERRQ